MQASVVERPPAHFVGLRFTAPFAALIEVQVQIRNNLLARQFDIDGIVDPYQQLGVTRPNETELSEESVTSYIGFEVSRYKDVPKDMVSIDLPRGRYAQFLWTGSFDTDEFEGFYPTIFGWLLQQKLAPSQVDPWLEIYGKNNDWGDRSDPLNELTVLLPLGGTTSR
jgi:predicted transcriptional regulator YdeE